MFFPATAPQDTVFIFSSVTTTLRSVVACRCVVCHGGNFLESPRTCLTRAASASPLLYHLCLLSRSGLRSPARRTTPAPHFAAPSRSNEKAWNQWQEKYFLPVREQERREPPPLSTTTKASPSASVSDTLHRSGASSRLRPRARWGGGASSPGLESA